MNSGDMKKVLAMKSRFKNKQQGAVLAVSLIILLVVTILSVQGIQTTLMQEKMTAAVRDSHVALEAAEAGLVDAGAYIATLVSTAGFNDAGTGGLYSKGEGPLPSQVFTDAVWASGATRTGNAIAGITPQYFIEELSEIASGDEGVSLDTGYGRGGGAIMGFKIFSRATGKNTNTTRIVVGYYAKRL